MEPIGSGLGLGRGGEQGALVGSKDAQPVREVGGVIGPRFIRDAQIRAEEGRAQLGDKLLGGVGGFVKPALQVAVEAVRRSGPVDALMRAGDVITIGGLERIERGGSWMKSSTRN